MCILLFKRSTDTKKCNNSDCILQQISFAIPQFNRDFQLKFPTENGFFSWLKNSSLTLSKTERENLNFFSG